MIHILSTILNDDQLWCCTNYYTHYSDYYTQIIPNHYTNSVVIICQFDTMVPSANYHINYTHYTYYTNRPKVSTMNYDNHYNPINYYNHYQLSYHYYTHYTYYTNLYLLIIPIWLPVLRGRDPEASGNVKQVVDLPAQYHRECEEVHML